MIYFVFAEYVIYRLKDCLSFFGLVALYYLVLALWYTIAPFWCPICLLTLSTWLFEYAERYTLKPWEARRLERMFPVWWFSVFSFLFLCFLVYIPKPHPPEACILLPPRSFFVLWTLKWVQTPISPLFLDWFGSKHSHRGHLQSLNTQVLVHCTYHCQTNTSSNLLTWLIFLSTS